MLPRLRRAERRPVPAPEVIEPLTDERAAALHDLVHRTLQGQRARPADMRDAELVDAMLDVLAILTPGLETLPPDEPIPYVPVVEGATT